LVEKLFDLLPKSFLRRLETERPITFHGRHAARHDIQRDESSDGKDRVHGLIFFVIGFFIVVVQIAFDIIEFVHGVMARAIAVVIAPVAIGTNRADDHDSILERLSKSFRGAKVWITA
jgi:hypothetical protein